MTEVSHFKGFISQCYAMLSSIHLEGFPAKVTPLWESDVGTFEDDQWEEALQAVQMCSLNVAQCLSQLYIVLWVHLLLQDCTGWVSEKTQNALGAPEITAT